MDTRPQKTCPACANAALEYDTFEDCWLCLHCDAIVYPQDIGEQPNPDAGIWILGH